MARTANVGRLSVSLDANTILYINKIKKLADVNEKKLNQMERAFKRLRTKGTKSLNGLIKKLGMAGAAYLSFGLALQKFNQQREMLDQLAKTSDALGIQQEKLQALQHVGELNGVTTTQMNLSLQRMQRNLGDAATGTGEAAKGLQKLGLNIETIEKMSPDKQMEALAQGLGNVTLQTDKAKLAQDFFGRNGVRVLKVLNAIKEKGLDPTAKSLNDMGIALNRADTAKIETMNDSIFKVQQVLTGLINKIIIRFAPALEQIADKFINVSKDTMGFKEAMESTFNVLSRGLGYLSGIFKSWFNVIQIAFNGLEAIFTTLTFAFEDLQLGFKHVALNSEKIFEHMGISINNAWTQVFQKMKVVVANWVVSIGEMISGIPFMGDMGEKLIAGGKASISMSKKTISEQAALKKAADDEQQLRLVAHAAQRQLLVDKHDAAQTIIAAKIAQNTKELVAGATTAYQSLFGPTTDPEAGGEGASGEEEEEDKPESPWADKLALYKNYLVDYKKLEDDARESTIGGYMAEADALAEKFGVELDLAGTYAKAEAAISAVQAGIAVWTDPTLSFYEKIPASIAAVSAVASLVGQFHGGTDEVPDSMNNKSFLLKAGERVVQPEANKKLTKFLDSGGSGGSGEGGMGSSNISISAPINISGNVTNKAWFEGELYKHRQLISDSVNKSNRERPRSAR
jgi:Mg2+ and Co2+ transporter CorA